MTGDKNVFKYITTEGKRTGKITALDYLQKNTGVFNGSGMLTPEAVEEMKARLQENTGNIWHGFISLGKEDSPNIDTPDKCIGLIRNTFGAFLKDAHLPQENIDLMCALHLDKPHHLHIHFVFWEKEPKYKTGNSALSYRRKGRIDKSAIDKMFVRLGLYIDKRKNELHKSRDAAIRELKGMTAIQTAMTSGDEIKDAIIALAKDLPKTGRLSYGSRDIEPYRGRVDKIVGMLLDYDGKARKADLRFYTALAERKRKIDEICAVNKNVDAINIRLIAELEADYKRRQGNLVLSLAKFIKPELYERKRGKRYKANDNKLKRNLSMTAKKTDSLFKRFISSFGRECSLLERDFNNRLQEIEAELKREKEKENYKEDYEK